MEKQFYFATTVSQDIFFTALYTISRKKNKYYFMHVANSLSIGLDTGDNEIPKTCGENVTYPGLISDFLYVLYSMMTWL